MREPEKSSSGIYILRHESTFLHWLAWKTWMVAELGVTYFLATMNAPSPWPPETYDVAAAVAERENAIRAKVKFGKAAPPNPKPWRRWTPSEMNDFELAEMARRDREGSSVPNPSCGKIGPREGFYRANQAGHVRDASVRNELDYALERRIGFDPKIGRQGLDNTIDRDRKPEDLAALLASARKRAPRMFGQGKAEFSADRKPIPYVPMTPERKAELLAALTRNAPDRPRDEP